MGNLGDRYLWRPDPRGRIYIRFTYRLPGNGEPHSFVKSLGTRSYPEARRIRDRAFAPLLTSLRCAQTAYDFVRFVARSAEAVVDRDLSLFVEGLATRPDDPAPPPEAAPAPGGVPPQSADSGDVTWGQLSGTYMENVRARRSKPTIAKYASQVRFLDEFFGRKTPVAQIDRRKVASLLELMEIQGKRSDTTINCYLSPVSTIFRFGVSRGLVESNPAEGVRIEGARHKEGQPFTREEADAVVAMRPARSKHYPQYLFPSFSMIARYTGARLGEIAVLAAEDLVKVEGIQCLRVKTEKTRCRRGRTYDENETRLVPVSPKLEQTVAECVGRRPSGRLFPRNGQWRWKQAHLFGKDFNRMVKEVAPGKSFKSWRHYAVSEMLNADVPEGIRKQVVGHKDGSVHGTYSHAYVQRMLGAVSAIY
jgi:integrase